MSDKDDPREIIFDAFVASATDLFEHYSNSRPDVEDVDPSIGEDALCVSGKTISTSIGIGADDFRCSVGFITSRETAGRLFEQELDDPADWLGELGNQLVGRIKNVVVRYGVLSQLGMPVSTNGTHLCFSKLDAASSCISINTECGKVLALISTWVRPGVKWSLCECEEVADEGSVCLF